MDRPEPILSNRPPTVRDLVRDATAAITDALDLEGADLVERRDELLAGIARVPAHIEDADTAQRVVDFTAQLSAFAKGAEARRIRDKEPILAAGRAIDGWYARLCDGVARGKRDIEGRLTAYQRAMAELERRRREEAERKRREEADKLRAEADALAKRLRDEQDLQRAVEAERAAARAEADAARAALEASAKASDLYRTRGDYGAVASLRTDWVGEVVSRDDLDLEALRQHLPADALEKAVRAFVRAGGRELRGARIYETTASVVR